MELYSLLIVIVFILSAFACGISAGALLEHRRNVAENRWRDKMEDNIYSLEEYIDHHLVECEDKIVRLHAELSYTQKYLSQGLMDDGATITHPGVRNTDVLPSVDEEVIFNED
jgi:hypothetical protein